MSFRVDLLVGFYVESDVDACISLCRFMSICLSELIVGN